MLATGKTAFNFASGLMMRPWFNLFFLMYSHTFFVTSVRAIFFAPQIALNASLSCLGAKIPFPAFFIASAFFFFTVALVSVVFFVVVAVGLAVTVVFVVV